ncbi:hypothetical protein OTU49_010653 [Cherax quadricarinatus]|uniref:TsaA-like domain-containing protein n=1 Tax=Cherax quadricarinatus TaxID=27406 RepID=A0AAW0W8K3_CHEQU
MHLKDYMSTPMCGDCLYLSGLDILDGTPVLDIKPYIPQYDAPQPLSSASENFAAQERRNETRDCGLFQGKNSENVTEIIVKENSYCSVTIAGGSQPNNKHKMKQNAPNSKLVCTEENPGGKKSQREFLKEKLSLKKVNETMSDTKIVNHLSLKQCDGRVLQPSEESGRDECNDSGNLNFSSTNCGKDLIACDKGDFASCRFKENSTSRINKGKKSHSTLGNKKHIKAQNHQVTCKPLNPSGDVGRVEEVTTASWLEAPPSSSLQVIFNPIAEAQVKLFSKCAEKECYRLEFLEDGAELTSAISSVLSEDPRSAYRRQKCSSLLYYFAVDSAHITAWFEGGTAEVLRVHPLQANMQRETSET